MVITIVVLIILAAVIINLSLGNNGIFNRVKQAKQEYLNAQDYEKEQIEEAANSIDKYIGQDNTKLTASDISFTPTNSNWKSKDGKDITNVKQALDSLYDN